jgi:ribosomal protein S18 acetylase RimI-like enzyme
MRGEVTTRPVRLPEDADFLLAAYRSTREAEQKLFGWSEADWDLFVTSQFEAQSRHYRDYFPQAQRSVVLVGGVPAGRLIVDRSGGATHIVDIALLPIFRRAGVGRELVNEVLDEADRRGLPVTCNVEVGNEARLFWERLGFVACGSGGAYIALERPCGISPR